MCEDDFYSKAQPIRPSSGEELTLFDAVTALEESRLERQLELDRSAPAER